LLLHSGGGQAFMDLAMRLGGRQPGGAAKIATIASGLFGMISGSAVANVATTGNFTIPMMTRLGYPRAFAAAVEAVASTGGQIAPPIMGAAAFVMAEILGVSYFTIILAAVLPAVMFYVSVFITVHFVAQRRGLAVVPEDELPEWQLIVAPRRVLPILAALGGLGIGIWLGRSIATAAFYGIVGLLIAFVATQAGRLSPTEMGKRILDGLEDAGKGMVIIGVLLAGAQVLVAMINLTGIGVTLSSLIVTLAGDSTVLVSIIVALVCLIMGMGLPTTAAYVLVAAVLAPAMTAVGIDPLAAHLFVFYFATISVITPPVCVAVFVGAGIAQTNWLPAAGEAVRLGAVTYVVPFMLLLYPGMMLGGGPLEIVEAVVAGFALVLAVPALLAGARLVGHRGLDAALLIVVVALAIYPHPLTPFIALAVFFGARAFGRRQMREVSP
jgi:TRAP transporter 4TM/12TM fusion protein